MTVSTEFHNWSDQPSEEAKRTQSGSPALMHVRDHHLQRWGGSSLSVANLYHPKKIDGTDKLSAHAGSAVDIRWDDPGPGRDVVVREMLPFYIGNSLELHVQAIHDYFGCRVWRANRSGDAAGGWRTQDPGSHGGKMGADWARWLHLEVNASGWADDRSVEQMLAMDGQPLDLDLHRGIFGLYPLNPAKPTLQIGAKGEFVLYAQSVISFKAGGAIRLDSDFGTQTATRVMDVQRFFSLPVTGVVDAPMWGTLDFLAVQ